jgi:hypothetical protein
LCKEESVKKITYVKNEWYGLGTENGDESVETSILFLFKNIKNTSVPFLQRICKLRFFFKLAERIHVVVNSILPNNSMRFLYI